MARHFLEAAGLSDVGSVRQYNEDRIVIEPDIGVVALADGMGGHRAGEVASQMAAEIILTGLKSHVAALRSANHYHAPLFAVDESMNRANKAIFDAAQAHPTHRGMGTTLAVALFYDNGIALGHIGDSRIYRLRNNVLELLTRDDSLLRDQIDLGLIEAAEASASHNRSLVTQALGVAEVIPPHLREEDAAPGDVYLLCSDGLSDLVDDADIELILNSLRTHLPLAAHHLVQAAKDNGGYDNVSVIVAKVLRPFPAARRDGWIARLINWWR
jgi:protein phosphatase